MFRTIAAALAATLALSATAGQASTIDVNRINSSSIFKDTDGNNAWYVPTKLSVDGDESGWVGAGAFRLTDTSNTISDFIAFCLQPLESMVTPKQYHMGSLFSDQINAQLQKLAGNAMDLVTNSKTAAAFQMAAWEITTETSMTYDINDGFFQITGTNRKSNKAEALAQEWLANIQNGDWDAPSRDYLILNGEGTQDLLTNLQPVPVPASGLLLLGGLAGAGVIGRRKKSVK